MSIDQDESSQVIRIVYLAKLAEQAERYDGELHGLWKPSGLHLWLCVVWFYARVEMVSSMKEVVEKKQGNLDVEQRNLLSVAYKNVIGARRASWRILSSLEQKCRDASETTDPKRIQEIEGYRKEVEEELNRICDDVLEVIDKKVMPNIGEDADEARVFFLKMWASVTKLG